jgi:hypothetical protein
MDYWQRSYYRALRGIRKKRRSLEWRLLVYELDKSMGETIAYRIELLNCIEGDLVRLLSSQDKRCQWSKHKYKPRHKWLKQAA